MRKCKVCSKDKPMQEFSKHGKYYRWQCKDCERARIRALYHKDIEYHKERNRKYRHEIRHGLGPDGYQDLLEKQNGICAICLSDDPGAGYKYFAVDHDHNHCPGKFGCGECIRGLLCNNCNNGLGRFKDEPERLERAAAYIRMVRDK